MFCFTFREQSIYQWPAGNKKKKQSLSLAQQKELWIRQSCSFVQHRKCHLLTSPNINNYHNFSVKKLWQLCQLAGELNVVFRSELERQIFPSCMWRDQKRSSNGDCIHQVVRVMTRWWKVYVSGLIKATSKMEETSLSAWPIGWCLGWWPNTPLLLCINNI